MQLHIFSMVSFGVNFLSSRKQNRPIWETYYNLIQIGRRSQNIKLTKEIKTQIMSLELLTQPLTQDIPTNLNEYLTYFSQGYEAARIQLVYYNRSGNFL